MAKIPTSERLSYLKIEIALGLGKGEVRVSYLTLKRERGEEVRREETWR